MPTYRLVVVALVVVAGCSGQKKLERDDARRLLQANTKVIVLAELRQNGINVDAMDPDPDGTIFGVEAVAITGVSQPTETAATATFTAEFVIKEKNTRDGISGEAFYRLFDDGWRLDSVIVKR